MISKYWWQEVVFLHMCRTNQLPGTDQAVTWRPFFHSQMLFSDGLHHVNVFQVKGWINSWCWRKMAAMWLQSIPCPVTLRLPGVFGRGLSKREETYTVLEQQHSGRVFTLRADLRPGRHRENGRHRYAFATRSQSTKLAAWWLFAFADPTRCSFTSMWRRRPSDCSINNPPWRSLTPAFGWNWTTDS